LIVYLKRVFKAVLDDRTVFTDPDRLAYPQGGVILMRRQVEKLGIDGGALRRVHPLIVCYLMAGDITQR
jgi:hypothetical protein